MDNVIVVDVLVPAVRDTGLHLRTGAMSLALDQRAFGPGQLVVAFGDDDGSPLMLACAAQTDPLDLALEACLAESRRPEVPGVPRTALVLSDEPVPVLTPAETRQRLAGARRLAALFGIRLVDWVACDEDAMWFFSGADPRDAAWWDLTGPTSMIEEEPQIRLIDLTAHASPFHR